MRGIRGMRSIRGIRGFRGIKELRELGVLEIRGVRGIRGIRGIKGLTGIRGMRGIRVEPEADEDAMAVGLVLRNSNPEVSAGENLSLETAFKLLGQQLQPVKEEVNEEPPEDASRNTPIFCDRAVPVDEVYFTQNSCSTPTP